MDHKERRQDCADRCPEWTHDDFELILEELDVTVEFQGYWSVSWQFGCMDLSFREDEEVHARRSAALFVWLWLKNIDVALARDLAVAYGHTWS